MDKKARRKAGKGEEGELWNTCTTNVAQSIVALCVCVCVCNPTAWVIMMMMMIVELEYTLSSCRPGRLVSKQLFRSGAASAKS